MANDQTQGGRAAGPQAKEHNPYLLELFKSLLSVVVVVATAAGAAYVGKIAGAAGKQPGFDGIPTEVKLEGTRWKVEYEDIDQEGKAVKREAILKYSQSGSRIIGEGLDNEGRNWIIEGAAAQRRVCYIYYDKGGQRLSFGTVILEMNNPGTQMNGQWIGWSPESNQLQLRKVTLTRLQS